MKHKVVLTLLFLFLASILLPGRIYAQSKGNSNLDPVAISNKYYNSIVKVLLYDSTLDKTDPDKAYLGRGSGFFVSPDGYIFTNRHVIEYCYYGFIRYKTYNTEDKTYEEHQEKYNPSYLKDPTINKITQVGRAAIIVQVFTNPSNADSFKLYHAHVVALDTANFDGAILKIDFDMATGKPIPPTQKFNTVPIGNSDSVKQGEDLCLLGFPAQFNGNITDMEKDLSTLVFGKHSGYDFKYYPVFGLIKTDAAVNSGNSGGPVFGPNGRVIGLATAAYEKTNVGLISPIDAMFYISALIPDLQKQVVEEGLTAPQKMPAYVTTALYKPLPIPNKKMLSHSNNMAGKDGNSAAKGYVVISVYDGLVANNKFTVPAYTDLGGTFYSNGGTFNITSQEFGANIRIVKPTFLKQKNNLVGYFFNISPSVYTPNWGSQAPIQPTAKDSGGKVQTSSASILNSEINISVSFGFSYTYLFNKYTSLGVYYAPAANVDPLDLFKNGNGTDPESNGSASTSVPLESITAGIGSGQNIGYARDNPITFMHTAGLFFKLRALYISVDYRFIPNINIHYMTPTAAGNQYGSPYGTITRSVISATLGVAL